MGVQKPVWGARLNSFERKGPAGLCHAQPVLLGRSRSTIERGIAWMHDIWIIIYEKNC